MALDGARSPPKKTDWPDRHFAVGRTKHAFLIRTRKKFEPGGIRTHAAGAAE